VAALLFSAAIGRLPEMGVRLALGAGRGRLVREFAIEAALVTGAAFGLAWLAAQPLTTFIVTILPLEIRHGQYLDPDVRTFIFGCALSLLGLCLLAIVPIGVLRRAVPLGLMSGRVTDRPLKVERLRYWLLVGQMTLTALLLYVSGLAVHSYVRAVTFDYGFDAQHVVLFTPPPWARPNTDTREKWAAFAERNRKTAESVERLHAVPGVVSATTFVAAPLGVGIAPDLVPIAYFGGRPLLDVQARQNTVGANFIRTLDARIIAGQTFDDPEYSGQENVVIVNETLARRLSPAINVVGPGLLPSVIGHELRAPFFRGRIIGVIKDLVDTTPAVPADPQFFTPAGLSSAAALIAIRVSPSTDTASPLIRAALQGIWGDLAPRQFGLLRDELRRVLVPYRAQSVLLSLIAAFCLPIAAIGLIGALTHSVRVRSRELAIRIAIGANPISLRRAVMRQALATVSVGIGLGTALGAATGSVVARSLFHVYPADLSTMVGVTLGLLGTAWLAALVPARQASQVEPAALLRQE
jgi:ABC-type antimicrobial peptide transport system permease subunit